MILSNHSINDRLCIPVRVHARITVGRLIARTKARATR